MQKKIILGIVLFLLFALAFGIVYLNNVYLPIKVKNYLTQTLETALHYNVRIEKLKYSLIRGLIIEDITVFDKVQDKESILLTIKEISGHILFLPLIKERKIIIPIIHVDSPYLYIRYQQDYKFNFSRLLLPPAKPQAKPRIKFSFLIYKINIFNGRCVFEDENLQPHFTKTIQDFNLGLSISPLSKIVFLIQGKLLAEKNAVTKLSGHGQYDLSSRELNAKINFANLIVPEFNPYLKALPLSISSGTVENSDLDLKFKNNLINLKGSLLLKGLELKKDNLALTGDIYVTPELNYAIDKKIFDYQANLGVLSAELAGLPYLEKVKNINGDIGLTQNRLWANNLKLQALDSDFTLKGTLDDFSNPFLKANLTCEQLSLEKFLSILPSKPEVLNLSGVAKANINIEGNLKKMPLDIKASLDLTEAKLQTAFLKEPLSNIKGKIDFSTDMLNWLNLNFNYLNTAYTSSGKLANFKAPQINFDLNSPDLDLKSDIKIKDKLIKINTLTAKFVDSKFNLKGDIDTQDNANPTLDLYAELNLKPQNAFTFLPQDIAETLKKMQLGGILNIKGSLMGKAKDYKNWNLNANAASDTFSIYNLKLHELSFNIEQKDGLLNITPLTASVYTGTINLDFVSNLRPEVPTYALKFNGAGIDLEKLKSDTNLKDKDIAGILNLDVSLNGDFRDASSLKGAGTLSIKEGKLWQLNLFKGLGELFLLPEYEKIVFKEALAGFTIADKSISTENLSLSGEQLNLNCQGKVGFDGSLDFTVYTQVNKDLIRDSADIRKFTSAILGNLSNAITIKVGGTIQKPTYKIVPVALDVIKNIKDFFLGK